MAKINGRGLSATFMSALESGLLSPVLNLVKADHTLGLYIRDDYVNVYYRGGSLLRITPAPGNSYTFKFDVEYEAGRRPDMQGYVPQVDWDLLKHAKAIKCDAGVALWLSQVPLIKQTMDFWFSANPKPEREFQQLMARANNADICSDYFVVDIEYTSSKFPELRADMLALHWPRTAIARKNGSGFRPGLTIIEMKWSDGALKGTAGIVSHVQKMVDAHGEGRLDFKAVEAEALMVFKQRVALGFIDCDKKEAQFQDVADADEQVDFVFVCADHDPDRSNLKAELQRVASMSNLPFTVKVAFASPMGFGLFTQRVISLDQALMVL